MEGKSEGLVLTKFDELQELLKNAPNDRLEFAVCLYTLAPYLLGAVLAARKARDTLLQEPFLHGDAAHREWLTKYVNAHFFELDEWLLALEEAR